jgi:cytochrome b6-f complex iron-sulfur subunit
MERKEFLKLLGLGAGAVVFGGCLGSCKKDKADPVIAPNVDFILDLTAADNASLLTNGGFIYREMVIVARTTTGAYIAVQQACSHQATTLQYDPGTNTFFCSNHGAEFSTGGGVVTQSSEGSASQLKVYTTTLTGTNLRVNG